MSEPEILSRESLIDGKVTLFGGDNRHVMRTLDDNSVDSIVTDPPYALVSIVKRFGKAGSAPSQDYHAGGAYARASAGFMGKQWDTGEVAFATEFWTECLRVLKPGGHVVAFSGTRTYHRLARAIEDAGFDIRDQLAWLYGSGFPKSHDAALDFETTLCDRVGDKWLYKSDGAEMVRGAWRHPAAIEWDGWGTALKPAWEPICLARKPLAGKNIIDNLLRWLTGALNIDACRVPTEETIVSSRNVALGSSASGVYGSANVPGVYQQKEGGRFPANVMHDGSAEVISTFPADDGGSAARFFYTAKADAHDRVGSKHPTVKPVDLMQWAVRLVTPKGGITLDPFAGTGTTGEAAFREGMRAILIEREAEYQDDIRRRMALALAGPEERRRKSIAAKVGEVPFEAGSLFAGL